MCITNDGYDGNKILVCTVGDLKPGDRYRTPYGNTLMVLDDPHTHPTGTNVVDLATGVVDTEANSVKLGRDRAGRLYASRSLNDPQPTVEVMGPPITAC